MVTRSLALVVVAGCTSATSLGVGATLDDRGHVGFEADALAGLGEAHVIDTNAHAHAYPATARALVGGFEVAFGISEGTPRIVGRGGMYLEYVRVGSSGAPWGYHVRLSLAGMPVHWFEDGAAYLALTGGVLRTTSQRDQEAPGSYFYAITGAWAFDLSVRLRVAKVPPSDFSHWQLAVGAARESLEITAQ